MLLAALKITTVSLIVIGLLLKSFYQHCIIQPEIILFLDSFFYLFNLPFSHINLYSFWQSSSVQVPLVFTTVQLLCKAAVGDPLLQLVNSTPADCVWPFWSVWFPAPDHLQDSVSAVSPIHTVGNPLRASVNLTLSSAFRTTARLVWSFWQANRALAKLRSSPLKVKWREEDTARNSPGGSMESSQVIYCFFVVVDRLFLFFYISLPIQGTLCFLSCLNLI